jgi:translation initiation factor 2 alpha subunit (eIF-2alpha)
MKDPIKITQEEVKSITDLQTEFQKSVVEFGNLYIEKMQVDSLIKVIADKESSLQEEWKKLQTKENDLIQSFYKKYGNGSLDLKGGLFIPNE